MAESNQKSGEGLVKTTHRISEASKLKLSTKLKKKYGSQDAAIDILIRKAKT